MLTAKIVPIGKNRPERAGLGTTYQKMQYSLISVNTKRTVRRLNLFHFFHFMQQAISAQPSSQGLFPFPPRSTKGEGKEKGPGNEVD